MIDAALHSSNIFLCLFACLDNKQQKVALATGAGPYLDAVRKAQLETGLDNVHCVDAKGLPLEPDGLHLTTSSQVRLGQMMVEAFLAIPNSAELHSGLLCLCSVLSILFIVFLDLH